MSGVLRLSKGWMRASGLVLTLILLAACRGTPGRLPGAAPQGSVSAVAEASPAADGLAPLPQEGGDAELSEAALIGMGEAIYMRNCAPCHQPNGEGNLGIFPALNRNAFVTVRDPTAVIDVVLHGRQVMPAFEATLSAQEVAAVISYVRNAWDNQAPVVDPGLVDENFVNTDFVDTDFVDTNRE